MPAAGFEADLQALQDFVDKFPDVDGLEARLTGAAGVTMPDFYAKIRDFTDGFNMSIDYQERITSFDTSARKLVAELRSLLATVKWITQQYQNAKTEDVVSANDVDQQFNQAMTTATTTTATSPSTAR